MMRGLGLLALVVGMGTGCKFEPQPLDPTGDGGGSNLPMVDSSIDGEIVPADGCTTFSSELDTCTLQFGGPITITGSKCWSTDTHRLYDSDCTSNESVLAHVVVDGGVGPIDMLVATNFTLDEGARLRVVGALPFGVVAARVVTISGELDATAGGAGARSRQDCGAAGAPAGNDNGGAPGGGGGAMAGDGGKGGTSDANSGQTQGGDGGGAIALPDRALGGCPGGNGGNAGGNTFGAGGSGGGAVYLVAGGSLDVSAVINVGGGGGLGGRATDGGGGGGGSGGMILLEGGVVAISGILAANGGGGGGGAGNQAGMPGQDGQPSAIAANGGPLGGAGSNGGDGGAGATLEGESVGGQVPNGGAGGGGGSVGFISIIHPAPAISGTISPALTPWP